MKNRTRRTFDKSFKLKIVVLHQGGKSSREIARDLDIPCLGKTLGMRHPYAIGKIRERDSLAESETEIHGRFIPHNR